jgi:hypothetical protein
MDTTEPASATNPRHLLFLFAAALGLGVAAWAYRAGPVVDQPQEIMSATDDPYEALSWEGLKAPEVTLSGKSDGVGNLCGRVHNESGVTIEKMKLTIKTPAWERSYDVKVGVGNNATATFTVFVGEPNVRVESVATARVRE